MLRMKHALALIAAMALLVLGGCAGKQDSGPSDDALIAERLISAKWFAKSAGVGTGEIMEFLADGTVRGYGGCNEFNGIYAVEDGKLLMGHIASTMALCGQPTDADENAFFEFIEETLTVSLQGNSLTLTPPTGSARVFIAR